MTHRATPRFWECYSRLPLEVQRLADENFELLKVSPRHPSLHLKKVGRMWSARVGIYYRVLAVEEAGELIWFWIGNNGEYDQLLSRQRR